MLYIIHYSVYCTCTCYYSGHSSVLDALVLSTGIYANLSTLTELYTTHLFSSLLSTLELFSGFVFRVLAANFEFGACSKQKHTAHDHFHGNCSYGKISTKKEQIRMLGFTSILPCHIINKCNFFIKKCDAFGLISEPSVQRGGVEFCSMNKHSNSIELVESL